MCYLVGAQKNIDMNGDFGDITTVWIFTFVAKNSHSVKIGRNNEEALPYFERKS